MIVASGRRRHAARTHTLRRHASRFTRARRAQNARAATPRRFCARAFFVLLICHAHVLSCLRLSYTRRPDYHAYPRIRRRTISRASRAVDADAPMPCRSRRHARRHNITLLFYAVTLITIFFIITMILPPYHAAPSMRARQRYHTFDFSFILPFTFIDACHATPYRRLLWIQIYFS